MESIPFTAPSIIDSWVSVAIRGTFQGLYTLSMTALALLIVSFSLSCSWYPVVYPQFLVKPSEEFKYCVWLLPLEAQASPAIVAGNL